MKLYGSTRSPYSRKVMIAVHELHLFERIEFKAVTASQTQADEELVRIHPLGQIPALLLETGQVLHDSLTICEYLDSLGAERRLIPIDGAKRWEVLCRHAVGHGMIETLIKLFAERKRAADPLHPLYVQAFTNKFLRVLPTLDATVRPPSEPFDLGDIAIACALSYADFRFPDCDWRAGHKALSGYYDRITERPSMRVTALNGEGTRTMYPS